MENLITALRSGTNVVAGQGKEEDTESTSSDTSSFKTEGKSNNAQGSTEQGQGKLLENGGCMLRHPSVYRMWQEGQLVGHKTYLMYHNNSKIVAFFKSH